MEGILVSGQDAKAKKASSYPGNVPSPPPELRINIAGSQTASAGSQQVTSEPLLSVAQGSSFSRPLEYLASDATSTTNERRASHFSDMDHLHELTTVLADLEKQHDAVMLASSSSSAHHGESMSLSVARSSSMEALKRHQTRFLVSARRFMELIRLPMLRDLLDKAVKWEALPSTGHEVIPAYETVRAVKSPILPALLEKYYDAAGEVKLQGETLVDLDYQYAEEVSVRMLQEDQGVDLMIPEDVFHDEYLRKRKLVEMRLDQRINDAEQLRAQCLAAGLDLTEGMRITEVSEADLSGVVVEPYEDDLHSLSDPGPILQPLEVGSSERLRSGGLTPAARSMLGLAHMKDNVSSWMATLETPGDEHAAEIFADRVDDFESVDHIHFPQMQSHHNHVGHAQKHANLAQGEGGNMLFNHEDSSAVPSHGPRSSISKSSEWTWEGITKQEAGEAFIRLRGLDLATSRSFHPTSWASWHHHEAWGQDQRDANSTTTPRRTWTTALGATLAEARAWISKHLSITLPTP
nr:hypothetical protein B0A51_03273 [Rachicladosporium sp. CCFEE 5018]